METPEEYVASDTMEALEEHMVKVREWQHDFGLPDAMLPLFVALFHKKRGVNPNNPTRMMRDLPNYYQMTLDVLCKLATAGPKTGDQAAAEELLQECKELLGAANEDLVTANHFPFLKLPLELRDRVYKHYIDGLDTWYTDIHLRSFNRRDEFLATFYKNKTIYFGCGCELRLHLLRNKALRNKALRNKISYVLVHWSGEGADDAFKSLRKVTTLRHVCILVTKEVFKVKSKREREWEKHFKPRLHRRLTDACGFDEVVELARHFGLRKVSIDDFFNGKARRDSSPSVEIFQGYLKSKCKILKGPCKIPNEVLEAKYFLRLHG